MAPAALRRTRPRRCWCHCWPARAPFRANETGTPGGSLHAQWAAMRGAQGRRAGRLRCHLSRCAAFQVRCPGRAAAARPDLVAQPTTGSCRHGEGPCGGPSPARAALSARAPFTGYFTFANLDLLRRAPRAGGRSCAAPSSAPRGGEFRRVRTLTLRHGAAASSSAARGPRKFPCALPSATPGCPWRAQHWQLVNFYLLTATAVLASTCRASTRTGCCVLSHKPVFKTQ